MAKRTGDPKREIFWRKALKRRERSGLTVRAFCEKEGLVESTYHYWHREIKRRDEIRTSAEVCDTTGSNPLLAPVQVIDDRKPLGVEVVAQNGWVVRVPEDSTTDHVRRVLHLVHEIS